MPVKSIAAACLNCGQEFPARLKDLERGYGKYCCRACYFAHHHPPALILCAHCGREFRSFPCKVALRRYCSRACYDARKGTMEDRFWSYVQKSAGCWEWTGGKRKNGYGMLNMPHLRTNRLAHRVSWELHFGPIPDGMYVCHRCDNKPCVNPTHLFLGTARDNVQDCVRKGRHRTGRPKQSDNG